MNMKTIPKIRQKLQKIAILLIASALLLCALPANTLAAEKT